MHRRFFLLVKPNSLPDRRLIVGFHCLVSCGSTVRTHKTVEPCLSTKCRVSSLAGSRQRMGQVQQVLPKSIVQEAQGMIAYHSLFLHSDPLHLAVQNLCVLSGLARPGDGWRSVIGKLPMKCRPAERLIFNVNAHDVSQRIDVSRP